MARVAPQMVTLAHAPQLVMDGVQTRAAKLTRQLEEQREPGQAQGLE